MPLRHHRAHRVLQLRVTVFIAALGGVLACATYQPSPLPPVDELAATPSPDLDLLEVSAAELQHPLLAPITLDLADGLSPDEAAVLAVLANPDLRAARDVRGEMAAQLMAAGLLPNPVLSAEIDQPRGAGSEGTVTAYNLLLGIDIKPLILKGAKVDEANANVQKVDLVIAWQEWQVARAAHLGTVRVAFLEQRLRLVQEELDTEAATVDVLQVAMEAGDATFESVGIHRSVLENLHQLHGDLTRSLEETRIELNHLLGLPPDTRLDVSVPTHGPESEWSILSDEESLVREAAASRLDMEALRKGYDAEEARVRQAVLSQFPSLSIGITKLRNESDLQFLGGFVTLGLPIFDHAQAEIALERATRVRLQHEYEARIAGLRSEVAALLAADELLGRQIIRAREGIVALAEIERAEYAGVLSGDVDRLAYQAVRTTLFDLRLQTLSLTQARLETREALSTTTGSTTLTPVVEGAAEPGSSDSE